MNRRDVEYEVCTESEMSRLTAIIIAVVVCIIVSLGLAVNHYRDNATEYKKQRDEKTQALNLANATITDMIAVQRDVAALDAKYTKELADAKRPLAICVGMSILVLNGCASPQPVRECPKPPPPPAWMMQEPRTYSRR